MAGDVCAEWTRAERERKGGACARIQAGGAHRLQLPPDVRVQRGLVLKLQHAESGFHGLTDD